MAEEVQLSNESINTAGGAFGTPRLNLDVPVPAHIPKEAFQPPALDAPMQPTFDTNAALDFSTSNTAKLGDAERKAATDLTNLDGSPLKAAWAATGDWVTTRVSIKASQYLSGVKYDNDTPIQDINKAMKALPFVPTEEEQLYLSKIKGVKEFNFAADLLEARNEARALTRGNTTVAGVTSFLDPVFFVLPIVARGGRVVSAVSSGAITGGAVALQEGPVSSAEIIQAAVPASILGGFLGGASRASKIIAKEVQDSSVAVQQALHAPPVNPATSASIRKEVSPAIYEDVHIPEVPAVMHSADTSTLPTLKTSKPRYSYGTKGFRLEFSNDMDKAAYIVGGTGKSKAHDAYIAWAATQGVDEATLIQRGKAIRDDLKAQAKTSSDIVLRPTTQALDYTATTTMTVKVPRQPARTERKLVKEAEYIDVPPELHDGAVNTSVSDVATAVVQHVTKVNKSRGIAESVMWNMHKELSSYGLIGKKVADTLLDNNSNLRLTSLESHKEVVLSGLRVHQYKYEDALRSAMAEDGYGTWKMINPLTATKAYQTQLNIEQQVKRELMRREQAGRTGIDTISTASPRVTAMADILDGMHKVALKELKAAGVTGAEVLEERAGYLNRKWSSQHMDMMRSKLQNLGLSIEEANKKIHELVSVSLAKGNAMDAATANEVAQAIITRAMNKGYFEDTVFNSIAGTGTKAEIRSILQSGGTSKNTIDRVMDSLTHQSDEAGKQGFVRHRLDLDYNSTVQVGRESFSIMDLIDGRVTSTIDQYNKRVSTTVAFARSGYKDASSVEALRSELSHSIANPTDREAALQLYDNILAHFKGEPNGAKLNDNFRLFQAYGRTIALAYSGLWQTAEYATMMGKYGVLNTFKYMVKKNPDFGRLVQDGTKAKQLNKILSVHSGQNLRLRPYLDRHEDGFELSHMNPAHLVAQTAGDLVPMFNAMKYIHHHQADVMGNLVVHRLDQAARGDKAARAMLEQYGLKSHVMDKLSVEIDKHGYQVDLWDDAVWAETRPTFAKMMDEGVLKERLGDMPSFAKFDQAGKVLFTYRSFTLIAHNKLMAGTVARDGASALALMLLYQFPLTYAAVHAQNVIKGKDTSEESITAQVVGQMGGLGLFTEPFKVITGQSNSVGSSATIPMDRAIKLGQSVLSGDVDKMEANASSLVPVWAASPMAKALEAQLKED